VSYALRPAVVQDAPALGAMHVAAWREAYPHILSEESFAIATVESRALRWRSILVDSNSATTVAELDGEIVGFASSGPSRDGNPPRPLELFSIYVLARGYGSGIGQDLLDAAIGSVPAMLWVAEVNPRAQAFYRRNGFDFDGAAKVEPFFADSVSELRMVR
jgi:ribosomal protein S18 acetylase RimI-like enzyme